MKRSFSLPLLVSGCLSILLLLGLWAALDKPAVPVDPSPGQAVPRTLASPVPPGGSTGAPSASQLPPSVTKLLDPQTAVARAEQARSQAPSEEQIQRTTEQILGRFAALQARLDNRPSRPMRGLPRGRGQTVINPKQQKAIDEMLRTLGDGAELQMDNLSGTLRYLRGDLSKLVDDSTTYGKAYSRRDYGGMALALAQELAPVMNLQNPAKELVASQIFSDKLGMVHVRLRQHYRGVPMWGAEIGVHFNSDLQPIQVSGVYAPTPVMLVEPESEISRETAIEKARQTLNMEGPGLVPPVCEREIYWDIDRAAVLSYHVQLAPDWDEHWHVFVAVADGSIVHRLNDVCTAAAVGSSPDLTGNTREVPCWEKDGVFFMFDTTKPMYDTSSQPPDLDKSRGVIAILDVRNEVLQSKPSIYYVVSEDKNSWDPTAVSVLYNFGIVENYFRSTFDRNSIDNKGMNIVGIIHARFKDPQGQITNDNAFWTDAMQVMVFGDGSEVYSNLPGSLDVTAHELTHGVTTHSANLIYENQPGALNEHMSDAFGAMVDRDDWFIGDGIVIGKTALRDMQDPHNPDIRSRQPKTMSEYVNLANTPQEDNGGVHVNSGIPNHMCYLLADGPQGIGREKTERILYRALTVYMTQRSQFIDYRRAAVAAARDLFGEGSAEEAAVKAAFDAVEITEEGPPTGPEPEPTPQLPTPGEPTIGEEQIIYLVADPGAGWDMIHDDYYYILVLNTPQGNFAVAPRYVANTRPAISGDGQWGLYVDVENNIYWSNGVEEEQWTDTGVVRTIAMSKDLRYIAFTSIAYDNVLYIIDTETKQVAEATLRVLQSDGGLLDLVFADVLTFNFRGDELVYDAVSKLKLSGGEEYPVWGIYSIRMNDLISRQILPQVPGEQIGNPIFAHTKDHQLLADFIKQEGENIVASVVALDFIQGKIGFLIQQSILSHPSYRGDDSKMLFRTYNANTGVYSLMEEALGPDGISIQPGGTAEIASFNTVMSYPIGFREGEYQPHQGVISVPEAVEFGQVAVNTEARQSLEVANTGNGDLEVTAITIEGPDKDSFTHTGINQWVRAQSSMRFEVLFKPQRAGDLSATLRVTSSDRAKPEVTVRLSGTGSAPVSPSPTETPATPTPTVPAVVPTPTATPTPTQPVVSVIEPVNLYEFDQADLAGNGWKEIPGGFTGAPPGQVSTLSFLGSMVASSQDKVGLKITVSGGEVAFIHALEALAAPRGVLLARLRVRADAPQAAVALALLKGSLVSGEAMDGSIATHIPATASSFIDSEREIVLLYEPDSPALVTPIIQVAAAKEAGQVNVYVDRLEVFDVDPGGWYDGSLFGSQPTTPHAGAPGAVPVPDTVYEFDQTDLASNGWKEIPGGFTGATPGVVSPLSFVGPFIPSSQDKVGLRVTVDTGQVSFIHGLDPVDTAGAPILLRVTLRADAPGAAVALAALKGDLSTGQAVDGSIATHIPATAASLVQGERRLVLLYQPDSPDVVTPILQVAAAGEAGTVNVFVDKLDILKLDPAASYPGSLFGSSPLEAPPVTPPTPTPFLPTPTSAPPTPTIAPPGPTPSPTPLAPTPTPGVINIAEQEPNDTRGQEQNLGTLSPGIVIVVSGNMSRGGIERQDDQVRYVGDLDTYTVSVTTSLSVSLNLDWTAQADLDLYLMSGGEFIDKDETTNRPAVISRTLEQGTYVIMVTSYDNPSDYTLTLRAEGGAPPTGAPTPAPPYPNDVSILEGTYYQDGDVAFRYEFDGQGAYQFIGYTPLSGDVVMEQGTYSISYPFLILDHEGQTERYELEFISQSQITLDGTPYVKG